MSTNTTPSHTKESARVREHANGSVGLMLGFVGGALGIFFLLLGAVGLVLLSYFLYELYFFYNR